MSWRRWRKGMGLGAAVAFAGATLHIHNNDKTVTDLTAGGATTVGPSKLPSTPALHWRTNDDGKVMMISKGSGLDSRSGQEVNNNLTRETDINKTRDLRLAIDKARQKCLLIKEAHGLPGVAVAVSVDGEIVWQEGFGYADIENGVKMTPESVIRIASISKSMTMAMMGKLIEDGKVDVDAPVQKYLPEFPVKTFEGQPVTITVRHLLSHLSGIRHYKTKEEVEAEKALKEKNKNNTPSLNGDAEFKEFFSKVGCETLEKAMEIFKHDELFHKPGTKYFYSTHAWTVVSAIIEKVTETPFPKHCRKMFEFWGLSNTHLDEHEPIIFNRAKHYCKEKNGKLQNCPWVDNSCKWAGGGFISNVVDLTRFAHIMMYSQQACARNHSVSSYLKKDTISKLWTGNPATASPNSDNLYGLGFVVGEPFLKCFACKERQNRHVSHSGGAVGACSYLLMSFPPSLTSNSDNNNMTKPNQKEPQLRGIVVALIVNFIDAPVTSMAKMIADIFEKYYDS